MCGHLLFYRRFAPVMTFVFYLGCVENPHSSQPLVSEIHTTVHFSGRPNLQTEGAVFVLDTAFATLYSIRFPECTEVSKRTVSLLPFAYAGHSDIEISSNWSRPTFIDLLNPVDVDATVQLDEAQSICDGVVTWARWDGGTFDLPTPEPNSTFSIQVIGYCQPLNGDEPMDFVLETAVPAERVASFEDGVANERDTQLNFRLDIDPTDMLQNIPCTPELNDESSVYALQLLLNLQQGTTWTWEWE